MRTFEIGRYELERAGQRPPCDGDEVQVNATVYLPCNSGGWLRNDIRFESRCRMCDSPLTFDWGDRKDFANDECLRCRMNTFFATTWQEASDKASEWAEGELATLEAAVAARRKAGLDAETTGTSS